MTKVVLTIFLHIHQNYRNTNGLGFGFRLELVLRKLYLSPLPLTCENVSVVSAMLGMVGASGTFGAVFFVTPELFPTNMITQASGLSSFMGRLGGMLAPFMTDLEEEISDHTV